jgi:glutamate 5-kinase
MRKLPKVNSLVIKIGSNILADSDKGINEERVKRIADVIAELRADIPNISVVSSGAIAAGFKTLGFEKRPKEIIDKQACAAVGQAKLMWYYEQAFAVHGLHVAQVLLTKYDFSSRKRYLNASATIKRLQTLNVTPIINENDTVVANELKYVESFGDNDNLSALVASGIEADMLLILSDVNGLYTADPSRDPEAVLIKNVNKIDDAILKAGGGSSSNVGTGGMQSKLTAAAKAVSAGCGVAIINGRDPENIKRILAGEDVGTYFKPERTDAAKKRWLLHATIPQGKVIIDAGAQSALLEAQSSLLASGIAAVEGEFHKGDIVKVLNQDGREIAIGKVRFSASDLQKIKQKRSAEIAEILGLKKVSAIVIHRDEIGLSV